MKRQPAFPLSRLDILHVCRKFYKIYLYQMFIKIILTLKQDIWLTLIYFCCTFKNLCSNKCFYQNSEVHMAVLQICAKWCVFYYSIILFYLLLASVPEYTNFFSFHAKSSLICHWQISNGKKGNLRFMWREMGRQHALYFMVDCVFD